MFFFCGETGRKTQLATISLRFVRIEVIDTLICSLEHTLRNDMSGSQIAQLSARIESNTAKFVKYFTDKEIPQPSFDRNGPLVSLVPPEAEEIEAARQAVIYDCQQLRILMLGPTEYVTEFGFVVRPWKQAENKQI